MDEAFVDKKEVKKEEEKKEDKKKPKFVRLFNEDQIEVKCLTLEDLEETVKVLKKCSFEVTENEVRKIVSYGMSYGCYVDRMIIGVGLSWPTAFDPERMIFVGDAYNALYMEEPAVMLMYEGRDIRRLLVNERERAALALNYKYAVAFLLDDVPKGSVESYITEAGSQLERIYLSENYMFLRTDKGVLAVKQLK